MNKIRIKPVLNIVLIIILIMFLLGKEVEYKFDYQDPIHTEQDYNYLKLFFQLFVFALIFLVINVFFKRRK